MSIELISIQNQWITSKTFTGCQYGQGVCKSVIDVLSDDAIYLEIYILLGDTLSTVCSDNTFKKNIVSINT